MDYAFSSPIWRESAENRIDIIVQPFNPSKAIGSGDERDLGIAVLGLKVAAN